MLRNFKLFMPFWLLALFSLTGCLSNPSMSRVIDEIGPVASDMSRVAVYQLPKESSYGRIELTLVNMYGYAVNQVLWETGCLFEVPPGDYQLKERKLGKFLEQEESSEIRLHPGKIHYFRIAPKGGAAAHVPITQAIDEIAANKISLIGKEVPPAGFIPKTAKVFHPYGGLTDQKELDRLAKAFDQTKPDKSRIYIIQDMGFASNAADLYMGLDGPPNSQRLKNGMFYCYEVNPGHHVISGRAKMGAIHNMVADYYVRTKAGNNYFFRMGALSKSLVPEAEGMELVEDSNLVENGFLETR